MRDFMYGLGKRLDLINDDDDLTQIAQPGLTKLGPSLAQNYAVLGQAWHLMLGQAWLDAWAKQFARLAARLWTKLGPSSRQVGPCLAAKVEPYYLQSISRQLPGNPQTTTKVCPTACSDH